MMNKKWRNTLLVTGGVIVTLAAIILGRFDRAYLQVSNSKAKLASIDAVELGSTDSLTILPLFEEWSRSNEFQSGHGVSYLIRTDEATILLDIGNNEQNLKKTPLLYNMEQLGISDEIDSLVISHNHPDHVGGIVNALKNSLEGVQELSVTSCYLPEEIKSPGLTQIALEPMMIAPGVATLGRQPFIEPFPFSLWDPLGWEQSLIVNVKGRGLVVITGCGHPSLERIIERAEAVFTLPVVGVVGGLHYLKAMEEDLTQPIEFLALRNPQLVALSPHDSSGEVLQIFEAAFPKAYRYICIGVPIELP